MFAALELRAIDPDAAEQFYTAVLGRPFQAELSVLPELARRRGAPPHWLGQLAAVELEPMLSQFLEQGAELLGPRRSVGGATIVGVRDPFGAVVALTDRPSRPGTAHWFQHHSTDPERAASFYARCFGCTVGALEASPWGPMLRFTSETGRGVFLSTARQTQVHPQWLFAHAVEELDEARAMVNELGGKALPAFTIDAGRRIVVADDAQGAAFALVSSR